MSQWGLYSVWNNISLLPFMLTAILFQWVASCEWKNPNVPLLSVHFMQFIIVSPPCPASKIKFQHFSFNTHGFPFLCESYCPSLNLFLLTISFIRPSGQAEHIISEYSFRNSLLCLQVSPSLIILTGLQVCFPTSHLFPDQKWTFINISMVTTSNKEYNMSSPRMAILQVIIQVVFLIM